ncbi:cell division protein FtsQ/DivIB [Runella sp.]|uniref:cell division protein FtsQ/DivIB n=1 Tax=Runella sp. TaxID=1960881 RepID=UPI003D0FD176
MKRWVWAVLGVIIVAAIVFFVEFQQKSKRCKGIIVKLDENAEYPFFNEQDIKDLITLKGVDVIEGMSFSEINLKGLEKRVMKNRLINNCQVFRDLSGNLVVSIEQQRPVGRLISTAAPDKILSASQGGYLTETGEIVPLSGRFAARTVLVSGDFFSKKQNLTSSNGKQLIDFLKALQKNPFWKAQVAEVIVANDSELTLVPQVGQHQIDFGLPIDFEVKFEKLKIFYKNILPLKGWGHYKRVSVKFRNQIVCE